MVGKILDHTDSSAVHNPGLYKDSLAKSCPTMLLRSKLVKMNTIHRMMLAMGNTGLTPI
jgi:hypothetical protein